MKPISNPPCSFFIFSLRSITHPLQTAKLLQNCYSYRRRPRVNREGSRFGETRTGIRLGSARVSRPHRCGNVARSETGHSAVRFVAHRGWHIAVQLITERRSLL